MTALEKIDSAEAEGDIGPGRRLILAGEGLSAADRLAGMFHRLSWRSPFHNLRLRGRAPLRLAAVPKDPVAGDKAAGESLLRGALQRGGVQLPVEGVDFAAPMPRAMSDYIHSFEWLRDLAAAATRERGAKLAEKLAQRWLAACAEGATRDAGRPDLWGQRILFWTAYAPYLLSTRDTAYRALFLGTLARGARHLDHFAEKSPAGLARVTAWAGALCASLVVQGAGVRTGRAEAGLLRALAGALHDDGGLISRSPSEQLALVELLGQLRALYIAAGRDLPEALSEALPAAASALAGATLADEALSSWQGGHQESKRRVAAAIEATGVRARAMRQPRGWGYQRLEAKATVVVLDAAPPPPSRAYRGGCASTLAFELSEGPQRLVVNCGGPGAASDALPQELIQALRTSAAHSTLTIADRNSTAIGEDGGLGKGVGRVELARDETGGTVFVEASHDGYVRRFGLTHQRQLTLAPDGRELRGQDLLTGSAKRRRGEALGFAVRFHLGPEVEASTTADGQGALLRVRGRPAWQFRCRGGRLAIEDSLWIDGAAKPHGSFQLVVTGECQDDGASVAWMFRRAG